MASTGFGSRAEEMGEIMAGSCSTEEPPPLPQAVVVRTTIKHAMIFLNPTDEPFCIILAGFL